MQLNQETEFWGPHYRNRVNSLKLTTGRTFWILYSAVFPHCCTMLHPVSLDSKYHDHPDDQGASGGIESSIHHWFIILPTCIDITICELARNGSSRHQTKGNSVRRCSFRTSCPYSSLLASRCSLEILIHETGPHS